MQSSYLRPTHGLASTEAVSEVSVSEDGIVALVLYVAKSKLCAGMLVFVTGLAGAAASEGASDVHASIITK
jgi:hypothetical protein